MCFEENTICYTKTKQFMGQIIGFGMLNIKNKEKVQVSIGNRPEQSDLSTWNL